MDHAIARAAFAALLVVGLVAPARAFECPRPETTGQPGLIKDKPTQIAELAPMLSGRDVSAQVPNIVMALRKRYPGVHSAELANYLIAAYCPGVADAAGLTDAEKTARVQDFSKAVLGVLY